MSEPLDDAFGHWLAGFLDGEGCFEIHYQSIQKTYSCRLTVKLRADDATVLEHIARRLRIGRVAQHRARSDGRASCPQVYWQALSRPDCQRIVGLLDRCPLHSKKARDYAIWREAVAAWCTTKRTNVAGVNTEVWERMAELQQQLRRVRQYEGATT